MWIFRTPSRRDLKIRWCKRGLEARTTLEVVDDVLEVRCGRACRPHIARGDAALVGQLSAEPTVIAAAASTRFTATTSVGPRWQQQGGGTQQASAASGESDG